MKHLEQPKVEKTFENFLSNILGGGKDKYKDMENLSKTNSTGEVDNATKNRILNVDNFNKWLANDWTGYGGGKGAPGIVGRCDKLSLSMVEDYFLDQGVECSEKEIRDFITIIRNKWLQK